MMLLTRSLIKIKRAEAAAQSLGAADSTASSGGHVQEDMLRTCWNVGHRLQKLRNPPGFVCKQSHGCACVQMI